MSDDKSWVYSCLIELMNAARAHQPPDFRDATLEACRKALDQYSVERAVIEAARAFYRDKTVTAIKREERLFAAVEALEREVEVMGDKEAFRADLAAVINRHSKENGSNTPDFILAVYLERCLAVFDLAVGARNNYLVSEQAEPSTELEP